MADRKKRQDDRDKTPRELDDRQLDEASGGGVYAAESAARESFYVTRTPTLSALGTATTTESSSAAASGQYEGSKTEGGGAVGGPEGSP